MTSETVTVFLTDYGPGILIILLMVLLSAFFSGSETALTAASRARMHTLEADGDEGAGLVNSLIERRDRLIGALLIGNNLANILSSSVATSLFCISSATSGVAYATLAMTVILVIFAEVLPKSWAISAPDRFALGVARTVNLFVLVVGPVSSLVNWIVRHILAVFGINLSSEMPMLTAHEEIRGAVDLLHREGSVIKADRDPARRRARSRRAGSLRHHDPSHVNARHQRR